MAPTGTAVTKHRHREDASPTTRERDLARVRRVSEHVLDLCHGAREVARPEAGRAADALGCMRCRTSSTAGG